MCWNYGAVVLVQFQVVSDNMMQSLQITAKEINPIIVAACIWGHTWSRDKVITCCDNAAVVAVLNSPYSKDKLLM